MTLEEIKVLLDQGKTEEVLKETEALSSAEAYGLRAWAHYRRKEFEKARQAALQAGENETAIRCLAAIAAYYDKDGTKMREYIEKLPESPARDNTFVIYAREPSDNTPRQEILKRTFRWLNSGCRDVSLANLLNNTSRWLHAKPRNRNMDEYLEDWVMAMGFMQAAIAIYGEQNLHHRAGAWYWLSIMQKSLLGKVAALAACETSVKLWRKQVKADPTNPHFQKSLEGAINHLKELKRKKPRKGEVVPL